MYMEHVIVFEIVNTCIDGVDVNVGSGSLVFLARNVLSAITIPIFDDSITESNEEFRVDLESSEATISTASAEVTIIDDDGKVYTLISAGLGVMKYF